MSQDDPQNDRTATPATRSAHDLRTALEHAEHTGNQRLGRRLLGYERVLEISRHLATLDPETVLERILQEILALTGTQRGAIVMGVDQEIFDVRLSRGFEGADLGTAANFALSRSVVQQAVSTRRVIVIENVPSSTSAATQSSIVRLGLEAVLAIPLVARDRALGALYADTATTDHAVSIRDRAVLEAFGAQASVALDNARLHALLERDYIALRRSLEGSLSLGGLVYRSAAMDRVCRLARHVAPSRTTVLIQGETGTGKELLARAIHLESERRQRAFVADNIGALPDSLAESELFGHCRGAFTGAVAHRVGLLEAADGGTLLLDEIGEASPALQVRLLRFLETGRFRRVGENRVRQADVRVIAATHRDLESDVSAGRFRADLYYRLAVFPIRIPPLRERRDDVPVLVRHFLTQQDIATEQNRLPRPIMDRLVAHPWHGNVRELRNVVDRIFAMAAVEGSLEAAAETALSGSPRRLETGPSHRGPDPLPDDQIEPLDVVEGRYLRWALEQTEGNQSRAARLLGLKRSTFRDRLAKHRIDTTG